MKRSIILTIAVIFGLSAFGRAHTGQENVRHYSNEWVVRLAGGRQVAELIAEQMGYKLLGEVTGFRDTYRMLKEDYPVERKRGQPSFTERLVSDSRVQWAEQQFAKQRQKRGFLPDNILNYLIPVFRNESSRFRALGENEISPSRRQRFNDELWDQQWYLQDTRTRDDLPKLDLHVLPCYDLGVTGKGVRVSILDDGLESTHYDLRDNYDPEISYDANDEDPDPSPRYDPATSNAHGTRCAGEVAMKANNGKCGVGVAHNSRIGAVRLLDGQVDDRVEGIALGYAHDKVDIYSASWGPNDDGKTVEGPGRLALEAIERGITEGRNGLGVIYVWAAGNGGSKGDNCECDGYTGSIYTLSIGSASQQGRFPWYGEKCASTMAATYSSGAYSDQMIATTDLRNTCTVKHTGTSASAPLAAGIIALALEINPRLTWRDMQHLVVWTSEYEPLKDNDGWLTNAAGLWVNTRFGFGLMNAFRLVKEAANWTNVPRKYVCSVPADRRDLALSFGSPVVLTFDGTACSDINYLEHVELQINIEYPVRGDLEIYLTSPAGTEIQLLSRRKNDLSKRGFSNWKLMSVLTWNENPRGTWKASVGDRVGSSGRSGMVGGFTLHLHGTAERPAYLREDPGNAVDDEDRWAELAERFDAWT
ncbi:UNVERIFIED_CONTAM: hypothetical protein PYX00_008705 [Menopon gallinae]|uniref:furin n=1 Tax=Menopon gallinae TaxID=328185 RepID=A0AAW2HPC3_9NEOP